MQKTSSDQAMRTTLHGPTMGTRWSVTLDAPSGCDLPALQRALAASVREVDQQMSPFKADSDLTRLNHAPAGMWIALPEPLMQVLEAALTICRASAGAFDPGVGALVDAWGFGAARAEPDAQAIAAARQAPALTTPQALEIDKANRRVRKKAALQLDLCGIAKGYAVDRMVGVLAAHGVRHALAALDGELRAVGSQADGTPWPVALESPQAGLRAVHGVIELTDLAVATSGDYRHFFDLGGTRVAHTMDTHSRGPLRSDVASVTVLARNCMVADAWATALLVAGSARGMALAQRMGLEALWLVRRGGAIAELGLGRFGAQ